MTSPSRYGAFAQAFHWLTAILALVVLRLLWLAGLHAVAARYHHLVLKDGVLASMLPAWFPMPGR